MNSETFTTEIVRMLPTLYRIVRSQLQADADQQDAVQEAIRRGWEKKANLKNDLFLQTWMIRILLNVCHDLQREQKRMVPQAMLPLPAQKEAAEHEELRLALFQLHRREREPVVLHYIEGYSVSQVARILRIPVGTVKTRLMRGRMQLRVILNEEALEDNEA